MNESVATVTSRAWSDLRLIIAAHIVMLRDAGLLANDAAATLLAALESVANGEPTHVPLAELVVAFDDRLDTLTPPGIAGAARVGRGTADVVAALLRLALRADLLELARALEAARRAALELASAHVVTLMPAYAGGQAAQPTTFAHFLAGLLGPLERGAVALRTAYDHVNQSPLGASALASSGLPIDRERLAQLLGFDGLVTNTFDAVAAVDHVLACADVVTRLASPVRRFLTELLTWLRTEPTSFRLAGGWLTPSGDLPHHRPPAPLEALTALAHRVERDAETLRALAGAVAYGPLSASVDEIARLAARSLDTCTTILGRTADLLTSGLEVNRAYLANRAGRAHTTSSDLADLLMIEEGIDPGAARSIAVLTIAHVKEQGIETSGITPEMIDAAALMVIGRELKVEFEGISKYLAPRRFLERRTATGSPSPAATRAWLEVERERLAADERWREGAAARLTATMEELTALARDAIARASP